MQACVAAASIQKVFAKHKNVFVTEQIKCRRTEKELERNNPPKSHISTQVPWLCVSYILGALGHRVQQHVSVPFSRAFLL